MANICSNTMFLKSTNKEGFEAIVSKYEGMEPYYGLGLDFLKEVTGAEDGDITTFGLNANVTSNVLCVDRVLNTMFIPLNSDEYALAIVFESKWSPIVISEKVMDKNLITGYMNFYDEPGNEVKGICGYIDDYGVMSMSFNQNDKKPEYLSEDEYENYKDNWDIICNESEGPSDCL